ncbi:hypothetical protein EHR01_06495 [Leptospira mtsangambouensis]|uniref:Uncharacterized protein n=1 Tax=Leptospira mtsangambouensis TaxID=2484912 RepID=A0ABY2P5C0_9LEPT|nr:MULTISPECIES: hypothetical protein [Leptospira]PJZ95049.1 hypothetical protein CH358_19135 [Leptospira meyeri]PKA10310.1 hypothetical protein CH372_20090 [Leptospira meyeri]PKA23954.1 hypothetical protein CH381_23135 [Leptospira sp. mixed culture ATI2-C-A1]TGM82424.1 hypothetical protein EHR01_06495 [Leptospira mtsangambouensis]
MIIRILRKLIANNPQSQFAIYYHIINPILGFIFTFIILALFIPLVYKNQFFKFLKYNIEAQNIISKKICERNISKNNISRIYLFLYTFHCIKFSNTGSEKDTYSCKKNNLENVNILIGNIENTSNLEFPLGFEKSLNIDFSFLDLLKEENRYLKLKLNLLKDFESRKIYYSVGYDQIYLIEELTNKYKVKSIFYDFGLIYDIDYLKSFNNLEEAQIFTEKIESLCIQ